VDNDGFVGPSDLVHTLAAFGESGIKIPNWATAIELQPDADVVTDSALLQRIEDSCYAWRVNDTQTQIEMLLIPDGTFQMGCIPSDESPCRPNESPTHTVKITEPFYMSRSEVTQDRWLHFMHSNPSYHQGDNRPVEHVSWLDVSNFLATSPGMRLPTEAEWEYAYLAAGTTTKAFHGFAGHSSGTNDDTLVENIAWYSANSKHHTHDVQGKAANGLGLYDMSGNVWEWVQDWYGLYGSGSQTDPTGPTSGTYRVIRGGSWYNQPGDSIPSTSKLRSSFRGYVLPGNHQSDIGFRVARDRD
jgi:formylglycine-generating enzyme required for sulfatase activity